MEWLANIGVKWVLVAVGALVALLTLFRLPRDSRDQTVAWIVEHMQVALSVVVVVFLLIRPFLFQAFYIPSGSMEPTLHGPPTYPIGDRLLVNKLIYLVGQPAHGDICVFKAPPQADRDEKEFIKRLIGMPGDTIEVVPPRLTVDGKRGITLTTDGAGGNTIRGISLQEGPPNIPAGAGKVTLSADFGHPLDVVASDGPVKFDPYHVEVDGKPVIQDPTGGIKRGEGLSLYGGDDSAGQVFTVDDEPRLLVLKGKSLKYEPGHVVRNGQTLDEPYIAEAPNYGMSPKTMKPGQYFMMGDNRNNSRDSHEWGPLERWRMVGRAEIIFWPLNRVRLIHWWLLAAIVLIFASYEFAHWALRPRPRA